MHNRASGQSPDELLERSVAALVREWGVTEVEAREAILRVQETERRRRRHGRVIRLTEVVPVLPEPDDGWTLYLDHGDYVLGKVEAAEGAGVEPARALDPASG